MLTQLTRSRFVRMRALAACAAVVLLALTFASNKAFAYDIGDQVKPQSLSGTGAEVVLPSPQKRWQYVDFWASWCAPCKLSFPWMNDVRESFSKRGIDIVAVNVDVRRNDADRFLKQAEARGPLTFSLAFDASGATPKAFAVKSMPSAYLIDPAGRVRWIHRGFREGDGAKIEAEVLKIVGAP